jgi:hypothetical protein
MANTTKKKSGNAAEATENTTVETAAPVAEESNERVTFKPSEIDIHQYVTVRNGFQGRLVYKSKRTGETFVWERFGDEQDMELGELKNAKNSNKKYFINNWFMFEEPWVVAYLGVGQFYKFAVSIQDFDQIFTMSPAELERVISSMSAGQKKSVAYRARQMIADGEIDSNKVISTLEKCLGVELVIR